MARFWRVGLYALLVAFWSAPVAGQPTSKLFSQSAAGTITANGASVEMQNTGGLGSLRVQTTTTYSGTWEVQCSVAPTGITPVYDTDDEVNLSLEGATSSPVQSVTDTLGIWTASIAGCTAVKVVTTAWTSGTLTVYMYATTTGGSSGAGGGGAASSVEIAEGGATAQVTATSGGALQVECAAGCGGSGGTSAVDDADFTDGTTEFTLGGGVAESAAPTTVTEGDQGAFAMTLNRAIKSSLYNASGTAAFGTAGTAATPVLTVQGIASMTPVQVGDNSSSLTVDATDLDVQSGGADILSTTAFNASLGTAGSADSQVQSIQGIASMTPVQVTNTTVAAAGTYLTARLTDGTNFLQVATDATHDSAASATGPQIHGEATSALTSDTAVADADAVRIKADLLGRLITTPGCGRQDRVRGYAAITDGSSTSVLAAQGANIIAEIWTVVIANSSATDVTVDLRDGTAGSVLTTLMAPATTDTGGGGVYNLNSPILFTANTAVAADPSASASTVYVTVLGCKVL